MMTSDAPRDRLAIAPLLATALSRSAHEGARIVALHWLHELVVARAAWHAALEISTHDADPSAARRDAADALHRARVALRRLRATLREHRLALDLDEGTRIRRALRRLNQATNALRDRDVQCAWLEAERDALPESARREAEWLRDHLAGDATGELADVSRAFTRHLDRHTDRLTYRLSRYQLVHVVGQHGMETPFARQLADRVDRGGAALRLELNDVQDVDVRDGGAQRVLHRIRIRLKRQRAMLAPFTRAHPAIGAWYALATQGQDALGAMRDAALLADRATAHGCDALSAALHAVALGHFDAFHARWCQSVDAVTQCRDAASAALRALAADTQAAISGATTDATTDVTADARHAPPTSTDGFTVPADHGLPMEIERKFLLHGLPPKAAMATSVRIEQGWLPGTVLRERLRRAVAADGTIRCTRTVKLGPSGARIEVEEDTTPALFDALWPLTVDARIRKRRHLVREGSLTWEVDVFLDRDLVLAEVELQDAAPDIANNVPMPAWLAPFVVREVTHEPAYLNSVMARRDMVSPEHGSAGVFTAAPVTP